MEPAALPAGAALSGAFADASEPVSGPAARSGPAAKSGAGPASNDGPAADGPAADGPEATGPEATGPEATGPEAAGPEATGPEAAGPEAAGPEAAGPEADTAPLPDTGAGIEDVDNASLTPRDMLSFVMAAVRQNGLVGHNLQGYNELVETGINRIMTELFEIDRLQRNERTQTAADRARKSYQIVFGFHDVVVGRPACTTYHTGKFVDLYPGHARLTGLPYSGPVTLGATVAVRAHYEDGHVEEKTAEIPPFQIGGFPIMVGSARCHTSACTRAGLKGMGEDPTDPGGYFIAKRGEYVVDLLENIRYNSVHIHRAMKPNEHVRAEFLSQPGGAFENSSQIRVRFMTNGQITVEINSTKFEKVRLPFFLLYRLFGMTDDRAVAETVVFDTADSGPITAHMLGILERAFQLADASFAPLVGELNRERLVQMTAERVAKYLTNPTAYLSSESAVQFLNEDLLGSPTKAGGLDKLLLPHMGQTSAERIRKLRFLGLIIHKMLLVHLRVLPPTDRDSYRNKRVHGAGVSLAKAFKTQVNNSIVIPIFRALKRELKNNPWESIAAATLVDVFRGALTTSDLNRAMEQAITAGNKTIVVRRRAATNRVSSQALERKNGLNTISALRTVITQNAGNASKQTERADLMRRVHPTYTGYICVAQSPDTGENVGMRKQLALTAGVCTAGEALPLRRRLLADPLVTPLDSLSGPAMLRRGLCRVLLNGEWVGACAAAHALVARYRGLRRAGRGVHPSTTIYWDPVTGEVEFWLDVGRLQRPLLIVDSNLSAHDAACRARFAARASGAPLPPAVPFVQNVRFTPSHARGLLAGRLSLADLVRAGVAEYVTPEEQENCLVAESVAVLRARRGDVTLQYSHCDVEQAVFGLAAHVSPFANHTQPARVTYETNQARQTGGWYVLNFPFRTDKNRFFQFYNEAPLVATLTHSLVASNGLNVVIAYMSYGGDNQEDSAIVNQNAVDRGMFDGTFFRFELAELEKGESFCNPDELTTKNRKPNACYEKLVDGFVRAGATVAYGDVLVGRVAKLARGRAGADERYLFTDRSIVYRRHEPAVVEEVLRPRGANDEQFGVVKLRYARPLRVGDKLSSRSGNKCLTGEHRVFCRDSPSAPPRWARLDSLVSGFGARPSPAVWTRGGWAPPSAAFEYPDCPVFEVWGSRVAPGPSAPSLLCVATADHRLPLRGGGEVLVRDLRGLEVLDAFFPERPDRVLGAVAVSSVRPAGRAATFCLSVPGGQFAAERPGGIAHWTGNSIAALMLSQSDMPYTDSGLTPDLIINPHCMPSRMTIGQLLETSMSKICARRGVISDGTAFLPVDHGEVAAELYAQGFRANGRERMFNGMTGEHFDAAIFIGPTAEQRLQKFVLDDEQSVGSSGPTDATTGQPLGGKHHQGGLRVGEMENWCLTAHNSMLNLYEKCGTDSDARTMHVCRGCGALAVFNEFHGLYDCRACGELADIAAVDGSKTAVLLHEELAASNVRLTFGLRPREFELGSEVRDEASAAEAAAADAAEAAADAAESASELAADAAAVSELAAESAADEVSTYDAAAVLDEDATPEP